MLKKEALIDLLLSKGLVAKEQIEKAKDEMRRTGLTIEKALDKLGIITEKDLINTIAGSMKVPYIDLKGYLIDSDVVKLIPEDLAKKHNVMPIFKIGETLTLAMANPRDIIALDEIRMRTKISMIEPVLATEEAIRKDIDQYYGVSGGFDDVVKSATGKLRPEITSESAESTVLAKAAEEVPVVKLVNMLIMQAVKDKASDIHIEPEMDTLRIRYRIDGILSEVSNMPKNLQSVVISRIKIMAKLDIAETRKPQDGRIELKVLNKDMDFRVSTFPTIHGENIVLRILDKSTVIIGLTELGFSEKDLKDFERLIKAPYGIILVTGPTGSGKTTTLYSALSTINSMDKNIITIEDPVEYELKLIRQTQVNPKAGLTFAVGLRSILRQDPDIVMVGEVRDKETADVAIQASLTGHLVFSTLHTNDSSGAVTRLIDMGVEPFLVASSVIGILAQRLVRVICDKCKEQYKPSTDMLKDLQMKPDTVFYRGKGCDECKNTGYKGRIGIFEFLRVTDNVKKLITSKASADDIKKRAMQDGLRLLREDGFEKAKIGMTTVEEVLRVTEEETG